MALKKVSGFIRTFGFFSLCKSAGFFEVFDILFQFWVNFYQSFKHLSKCKNSKYILMSIRFYVKFFGHPTTLKTLVCTILEALTLDFGNSVPFYRAQIYQKQSSVPLKL